MESKAGWIKESQKVKESENPMPFEVLEEHKNRFGRYIIMGVNPENRTIEIEYIDGEKNGQTRDPYVQEFTNYPTSLIQTSKATKKLHPTEKPLELFEYLIKTYTNEGMLVLDNCIGSGTTAEACKNTNRRFIGIEKDAHYFEVALNRISNQKIAPNVAPTALLDL